MRATDIVLFTVYTVASVVSLLLIKSWLPAALARWSAGTVVSGPALWVSLGALLYVTSFLVWMSILARNDLSQAYPIAIGLTLLFSTIAARMILQEDISTFRIVGMVTIVAGIAIVVKS